MHEVVKAQILEFKQDSTAYEEGFSLREEGIYMLATVRMMSILHRSVVRLVETLENPQIGFFEVKQINGLTRNLATFQLEDPKGYEAFVAQEKIDDISIKFTYLNENQEPQTKYFDMLEYLAEITTLNRRVT